MKKLLFIFLIVSSLSAQTRTDADTLYADVVRVGGIDFGEFAFLKSTADYQIARGVIRNSVSNQMSALELQGLTNNVRLGFDDSTSILSFYQNISALYKNSGSNKFSFDMVGGSFSANLGKVEADSFSRAGSTVLTGTWHSGLSASALGNVTAGTFTGNGAMNLGSNTLTTTGAGSFGALSGTTGTFTGNIKSTNTVNSGIGDRAFLELGTTSGGSTTNTAGVMAITSDITSGNRVTDLALFTGGSNGRFEGMRLIGRNGAISKIVIGDTVSSATTKFTVKNNTTYSKIEMWRNSRGDSVAFVDSSGAGTFGSGGSAFTAVVDSGALELTSSSVQYRALQTAYGQLYIDTTTAYTLTLTTADTPYTVKQWNQTVRRKNVSYTDSSIIVHVAGTYDVAFSLSSSSTSANTDINVAVYKNWTRQGNIASEKALSTANDKDASASSGLIYCSAGDYLQLRVKRGSGAGSAEITHASLVATKKD